MRGRNSYDKHHLFSRRTGRGGSGDRVVVANVLSCPRGSWGSDTVAAPRWYSGRTTTNGWPAADPHAIPRAGPDTAAATDFSRPRAETDLSIRECQTGRWDKSARPCPY